MITVEPHSALLTRSTEWFGKMTPYVFLKVGANEWKTSIAAKMGTEPTWNDKWEVTVNGDMMLEVRVMDKERFTSDDLIGSDLIPLAEVYQYGAITRDFFIFFEGKHAGHVNLTISFKAFDPSKVAAAAQPVEPPKRPSSRGPSGTSPNPNHTASLSPSSMLRKKSPQPVQINSLSNSGRLYSGVKK